MPPDVEATGFDSAMGSVPVVSVPQAGGSHAAAFPTEAPCVGDVVACACAVIARCKFRNTPCVWFAVGRAVCAVARGTASRAKRSTVVVSR
jgi:hypothetical protein